MNREQQLELEILQKQAELRKLQKEKEDRKKPIPFDPEGTWKVTTEGDCEGRSTRHLGIYEGHVLDVVRQLAGQVYYQLTLERVQPQRATKLTKGARRSVQFHVRAGDREEQEKLPSGDSNAQFRALAQHLRDGESLKEGNYYNAVELTWEVK
ncbi:hypothetical protein HOBO_180 [Bacillus phage Hobo]|uniref:Uncharacterized protein n=2 Tax=Caeruleovirus BM15 TaxID=1985178 RepID=A0A0S2MUL9_9CAUD|nr:hypothetical protein FD732_gp162 [Bacillus phage BM15]ALO79587.1 hypothetical protein BM10_183 [Bacillus phage BM15]AXQ66937.1 hypothetical protein HOBO_180 [Bacillus phage Hobo]